MRGDRGARRRPACRVQVLYAEMGVWEPLTAVAGRYGFDREALGGSAIGARCPGPSRFARRYLSTDPDHGDEPILHALMITPDTDDDAGSKASQPSHLQAHHRCAISLERRVVISDELSP